MNKFAVVEINDCLQCENCENFKNDVTLQEHYRCNKRHQVLTGKHSQYIQPPYFCDLPCSKLKLIVDESVKLLKDKNNDLTLEGLTKFIQLRMKEY